MSTWLNNPRWYAVQTKPHQEIRANNNLNSFGIKTFFPQVLVKYKGRSNIKTNYYAKPFFSRYLFANFSATDMLQKVKYTRGVQKVVSFGNSPCVIDDDLIELIKSQTEEDGFIHFKKDIIKPGDKVVVNKPHLMEFVGIFEHETKDDHRVSVLLTTVSYQVHVIVEKDYVTKCQPV